MTQELSLRILPREAYNEQSIMAYLQQNEGIRAQAIRVLKRSIDARQRTIYVNLTVRVYLNEEPEELLYTPVEYHDVSDRPEVIVVGAGPGGLFAALRLIELGLRPIVIERGKDVHERKKDLARIRPEQKVDPESNYSFGEGGAGAYSDGKLYTRSKKRGNSDRILNIFVQHGASPNILADAHPHIGTDRLPRVIENMRNTILKYGGEVHFQTKMTGLVIRDGKVIGIEAVDNSQLENSQLSTLNSQLFKGPVILATGHSARDVYRWFADNNIEIEAKGIAVGVRLEHPAMLIDQIQYHSRQGRGKWLPAAEYSMVQQVEGRGVYSFCMCPGGYIVNASSEEGGLAVNGMSDYARDSARANSAIVVTVGKEEFGSDDPLAGMRFQEMLERRAYRLADGRIPVESYVDFSRGRDQKGEKPAYSCREVSEEKAESVSGHENYREKKAESVSGAGDLIRGESDAASSFRELSMEETERLCLKGRSAYAPLHRILPADLLKDLTDGMASFERTIPGFTGPDAWVCGLESRTSSPVRIERDGMFQSRIRGLIPCGEGAGYAGGIMSAAVDGIKAAEMAAACINHHSPIQQPECQENYSKRIK